MTHWTLKQRKSAYLVGILVLLIPIIYLGMPASGAGESGGTLDQGGALARARSAYELGEDNLGNVDPSSATMNLVLLGQKGVATTILWNQNLEYNKTKNWAKMRSTTESITMLQPHYIKVWRFHGWNLAWNVSAEWDNVEDRYFWVKEGGKFTKKGTERNSRNPELLWDLGWVTGQKVGRSDEWRFFREFFMSDPDQEQFKGGVDPEWNPGRQDNYLAAKEHFHLANNAEEDQEQHIMQRMLFRHYPARSQFDFANTRQREGKFDETTREGWYEGFNDWVRQYANGKPGYGQEVIQHPYGGKIWLAMTPEELEQASEEDGISVDDKKKALLSYQNRCNFRYWKTRAEAESEGDTEDAHRKIYDGQRLVREQQFEQARTLLREGMQKYEKMLVDYQSLAQDDLAIEEALLAVLYWQHLHNVLGEEDKLKEDYPLKSRWTDPDNQGRIGGVRAQFERETRVR